ncbi:MAG: hypothetical protein BECKG1743D_GA0114223_108431 [Candidatus Kentron sp. G]|nr:MAG: hypothetical protein BECKG1743F_GA0114225_108551 [Candidatus Kentron sp. G]VFN05949.1 MAG: hypothetical protein BECKG1743E_GA0114224_109431 [Candidatus Kentron sp. G]VFN06305.1 MAG: hypothetical protein BECKG1743D_GA0114223_108431 [Candidatus Kentron sp. G]
MPTPVCEVSLDLDALRGDDRQAWLTLLDLAVEASGICPKISHFSGTPPNDGSDFAYIADSAGLSPRLLLNVPRLFVQPRGPLGRIHALF